MESLTADQMIRVARLWQDLRRKFLQEVSAINQLEYFSGQPGTEGDDIKPYAAIIDTAGAQIVAQMSGVATPAQVLDAIYNGAFTAGLEAERVAYKAGVEAGMRQVGIEV